MLIKTKDGLEIEVDKDAFNDMRVLDALCEVSEGEFLSVSKVLNLVMSKNEKKKLYDFIADENGKVTVEKFTPLFTEIMGLLGDEVKN